MKQRNAKKKINVKLKYNMNKKQPYTQNILESNYITAEIKLHEVVSLFFCIIDEEEFLSINPFKIKSKQELVMKCY